MSGRKVEGASETDEEKTLSTDDQDDEAEEDDGDEGVSKIAVGVCNVAHAENVQLLLAASSGGIDGEENGPCDQAAGKGDDDEDFEISQPEIAIHGVVFEDIAVGEGVVVSDDAEEADAGARGALFFLDESFIGSGSVDARGAGTEEEEKAHGDDGDDESWDQG